MLSSSIACPSPVPSLGSSSVYSSDEQCRSQALAVFPRGDHAVVYPGWLTAGRQAQENAGHVALSCQMDPAGSHIGLLLFIKMLQFCRNAALHFGMAVKILLPGRPPCSPFIREAESASCTRSPREVPLEIRSEPASPGVEKVQ